MSFSKYQPLDLSQHQIRLLTIDPNLSQDEGLIQCRIRNFSFLARKESVNKPRTIDFKSSTDFVMARLPAVTAQPERPSPEETNLTPYTSLIAGQAASVRYVALSYTWGPSCFETEKEILINDGRFRVRENLWKFLAASRGRITDNMWIDQLCIDQLNVAERNHQVMKMAQIYAAAAFVIIWLGTHADLSYELFSYLADPLRKGVRDFPMIYQYFNIEINETVQISSEESHPPIAQEQETLERLRCASEALAHREYWSRLWVVQEILWAQDIIVSCGGLSVSWTNLLDLMQFFGIAHVQELANARSVFKERYIHPPIVLKYCQLGCSEKADKVFALQSLFPPSYQLEVDYTKPLKDIFLDLLRVLSQGPEWFGVDGGYYWPPNELFMLIIASLKKELDLHELSEVEVADAILLEVKVFMNDSAVCSCFYHNIRRSVIKELQDLLNNMDCQNWR